MKILLVSFLILGALVGFAQPNVILYNGKIFTSNKAALWVEAVALDGTRISAVGNNADILKIKGMQTRTINLGGRVVVPGFNDAHAHLGPNWPGRQVVFGDDPALPTPWEVVRDSLKRIAREVPEGTWIMAVINPDLFEDNRVHRLALDSIAPGHPVMLSAWTGHGKVMNTLGLQSVGLNAQSVLAGGTIHKGKDGALNGRVDEYASFLLGRPLTADYPIDRIIEDMRNFHNQTASWGITTMQNMSTGITPERAREIYASPQFACRTRLIAFPATDKERLQLDEWKPLFRTFNKLAYGSGVKMILDGTPVERLACMREPYNDRDTYGRLNFSLEAIKDFMEFCLANDQQIIIHAVGDSTIVTIIQAMRQLHPDSYWKDKRVRLEHGEMAVVTSGDLQTLKDLGIVVVQNPLHLALPDIMKERLGTTRTKYVQAMRSLIDNDIPLAFGSDGPANPFLNLMFATLHPDNPGEAITREEAVIAYTHGSAYAEFSEKDKGTLEVGKVADLAVLSQDIFSIPVQQLPATRSILTFLDGVVVYDEGVLK
jgi:predicted amidohydrolase YtcJ